MNRFNKVANIEGNRVHISALWLLCIWNSLTLINTIKVWYHISLYKEQCKLAIHFAEHNFGPFGHIFLVIVLFEPESKTLLRLNIIIFKLVFSDFQACIFYFGIYRIFIFLGRPVKRTSKESAAVYGWRFVSKFNKNIHSTSTNLFNFNKFIHSTSTNLFIFNKNIHSTSTNYSYSTKIFIQLQQIYSHSTKNIHSTSTNSFIFNKNIHSTSTKIFIQLQQFFLLKKSRGAIRWFGHCFHLDENFEQFRDGKD
jgi:hypothetical protein